MRKREGLLFSICYIVDYNFEQCGSFGQLQINYGIIVVKKRNVFILIKKFTYRVSCMIKNSLHLIKTQLRKSNKELTLKDIECKKGRFWIFLSGYMWQL